MDATTQLGFQHVFEPAASDWTLLLLHGTGGDEHDLVGLGRQLAPSAALLSPRGKVLEAGMPRFFRRLAVGQLDIPDLLVRTDELAAFVTAAAQAYGRDPGKIAALGFSNGANIAVSLLLRHPTLLQRGRAAAADAPLRARGLARARRHRRPHRRRRGRPVFLARADAAAGRGAGRRRSGGHRAHGAGRRAQPRRRAICARWGSGRLSSTVRPSS